MAVAVRHLTTGEHYEWNADRPQGQPVLIKLAVIVEPIVNLRRKLRAASIDRVPKNEMVEGSGILTTHFSPGTRITLRDAIRLMIAFSDNTATNLVLEKIGIASTGRAMANWDTRKRASIAKSSSVRLDRSRAQSAFGLGSTTANDMVDLLARLYGGKLLTPVFAKTCWNTWLRATTSRVSALLPPGTKIYHKTGSVAKIRTDAGIIETPGGASLCVS